MARKPAVAGQFYPDDEAELKSMLKKFTPDREEKKSVLGALSPHAGYVFCGAVMGQVFGGINVPESVIVLNPSHRVSSPAVALWRDGPWETPLGEIELDEELCDRLEDISVVTADQHAHSGEHSGEVVLPFLQYQRPDVKVAIMCVTTQAELDDLLELGDSIAELVDGEDTLVVASSDMSHESGTSALDKVKRNDPMAIEKMEQLDPPGLLDVCKAKHITMCGVLPAVAMMESVRKRGGSAGSLIDRATSADSPYGGGNYVVGYAGLTFE